MTRAARVAILRGFASRTLGADDAPGERTDGMSDATNDKARGPASGFTIATLMLALMVGGYLRGSNLGGREMSADEGASWAAASAPTMREVLRAQNRLNPGKAGLHDITLYLWMRAFGDDLVAMR